MSYKYCCFMGPPGVGKGTQAVEIAKKKDLKHISTGAILREALDQKTPIGLQVQAYMDKGLLVPDDLMIDLVEDVVSLNKTSGYILDGFPRTLVQAKALEEILESNQKQLQKVFLFHLDERRLVQRLTGRRMAPVSGKIYHIEYFPPKNQGYCDETGEKLVQRPDDQEEIVRARLKDYYKQHKPLVDYYKDKGLIEEVDAGGKLEKITEKLLNLWFEPTKDLDTSS